ncbi:MAG: NAD(P)/FAD-dependent oxidoreductase [Rhodospirillales bacterium]|nr:NAD(P)/FAD-dependent oxidoreductase [Rhodospirillales bacterium]
MSEQIQTVVIGAGVVGLAIARRLAMSGREVILLESEDAIGTATSARNSEVIHAGIYYPKGSLKARFCVAGNRMLYAYCQERAIPHKRMGKLIVATSDGEVPALQGIAERAAANGAEALRLLSRAEISEMEPNLSVSGALFSPSTGIIDSHSLMLSYQGEAEDHGAMIAFMSPVEGGRVDNGVITLSVGGDAPMELECKELINSAGLGAQAIAAKIQGLNPATVPPLFFAKGNYFTLTGKTPFNHLIYPVPVPGGLGTHSTLDLGGQTKFGPDVEWSEQIDYTVDKSRGDGFYAAIRRYWPGLPDGSLQPGYVGIRPKLAGPDGGKYDSDFLIQGAADHGIKGLINLYGIESPGLTSSLAIADHVLEQLEQG